MGAHTDRLDHAGQFGKTASAEGLPLVKLFMPDGAGTWLLSETDPDDPDIAFGLCDLGFGCPELGSVRLSELAAARGGLGLPIERDLHFRARHRLTTYADQARAAGRIVA